jgi:hypothetical protein
VPDRKAGRMRGGRWEFRNFIKGRFLFVATTLVGAGVEGIRKGGESRRRRRDVRIDRRGSRYCRTVSCHLCTLAEWMAVAGQTRRLEGEAWGLYCLTRIEASGHQGLSQFMHQPRISRYTKNTTKRAIYCCASPQITLNGWSTCFY